jgi:hypothetical protein
MDKSGKKAGSKSMAAGSAAPKRIATTKKSAPAKKPAAKKVSAAKKPAPAKKPVAAPVVAKAAAPRPAPAAAAPRPAQPAVSARPAVAAVAARPAASNAALDERRKAATRKFFARLRSLEAIVGADLRKRGSVVLMQAVDQWYNEAISATATDVTITNAAKTVITHL